MILPLPWLSLSVITLTLRLLLSLPAIAIRFATDTRLSPLRCHATLDYALHYGYYAEEDIAPPLPTCRPMQGEAAITTPHISPRQPITPDSHYDADTSYHGCISFHYLIFPPPLQLDYAAEFSLRHYRRLILATTLLPISP